jgi:hypothetical protein
VARPTGDNRIEETKIRKKLIGFALAVLSSLATAASAQVKVEDHVLGKSAEQFFSEGHEGEVLSACAAGDFKSVNRFNKKTAKEYCAHLSDARQSVASSGSGKYKDEVSADFTRTTTYVFVAGKFVAAEVLFTAPDATNSYHGKSFEEIFAGLKSTYGPPTNESLVPMQNAYGAQYQARRELWLSDSYAIEANEQPAQPGVNGWTSVNVSTREMYDKLKAGYGTKPPANPLDR